jgi:ABC-type dipeptide/oligopeptide/nickel transport system permease component
MSAFVVRRLVRLAVVIVGVSLVTFAILHASGDPVSLIMPEAPEADRAVLRRTLGLHDPLPVQFARFVGSAVTGNFGQSFFYRGQSASRLVLERMPTTLMLTVLSMAVALAVALPVGIYSAVRRGRAVDQLATGTVFLGQSMPVFWTGIMLILLFSVQWRLLPVSGWESWAAVVLPTATLSTFTAPLLLRIVRSSMLDVIGLDYVRTARAKGVAERGVIARHALRNAMIPIVTVIGGQMPFYFGGSIVMEHIFGLPGLGSFVLEAISRRDYPVIQAVNLFVAALVIVTNLLVDLSYGVLDPRLRQEP